jgi:cobalt/nickel transport system permease protein
MSATIASRGVLERTVDRLLAVVRQTLFAEVASLRDGFLQRRDARAKLGAALALLIASGSAHEPAIVAGVMAVAFAGAGLSRIGGAALRTLFVPLTLISASLAIPALVITPGEPLLVLADGIAITDHGARSAVLLMLRVFAAAAVGLTLVLTTAWPALLAALRSIGLPAVVVMLFGMTYRYVFLLLRVSQDMFVARRSRTVDPRSAVVRKVIVRTTGVLMAKSLDESERVFLAMTSRGFNGDVRLLTPARMRGTDWALLATAVIVSVIAVVAGRSW